MKKLLIILAFSALTICYVDARDYTKLQVKEMKHAQKYGTTKNVVQSTDIEKPKTINSSHLQLKDPKIMKFGNYEQISEKNYNAKLKKDEESYEKYAAQLWKKHSKYYTTQADAEDFYSVYRVLKGSSEQIN